MIEDYIDHMEHHLAQILSAETIHPKYHITTEEAMASLEAVKRRSLFITLLSFGELEVEYYKPDKIDKQLPHDKDELYAVIAGGSGQFIREGGTGTEVKEKDVLFVKAGQDHRFENFTDDFATPGLFLWT